jgi:hypothetical protein
MFVDLSKGAHQRVYVSTMFVCRSGPVQGSNLCVSNCPIFMTLSSSADQPVSRFFHAEQIVGGKKIGTPWIVVVFIITLYCILILQLLFITYKNVLTWLFCSLFSFFMFEAKFKYGHICDSFIFWQNLNWRVRMLGYKHLVVICQWGVATCCKWFGQSSRLFFAAKVSFCVASSWSYVLLFLITSCHCMLAQLHW